MDEKQNNSLILFQEKSIRRVWYNDEWYYSVVDIVQVLTDSINPRNYWNMLKKRESESGVQLYTICVQLKLVSSDGKKYATDCANTESVLRIIQSIPSRKAEPFKRWLAEVGNQRIQEIENPELAQKRMKKIYRAKGYSDDWIEKRVRGIVIRDELTDEWGKRGVKGKREYAILTAEISKATFGMTPSEYKKYKKLPKQSKTNLRDHMNDLELIFSMLGERMTTEISQEENPDSFTKNRDVAKRGGKVAGDARKNAEKELGRPVTSGENYLSKTEKKKKKLVKK